VTIGSKSKRFVNVYFYGHVSLEASQVYGRCEEEASKKGMQEKSCEFTEMGIELYAKA